MFRRWPDAFLSKICPVEIPDPIINDGEILVKVSSVGVCPTDVKAYYFGSKSIKTPIILGHFGRFESQLPP